MHKYLKNGDLGFVVRVNLVKRKIAFLLLLPGFDGAHAHAHAHQHTCIHFYMMQVSPHNSLHVYP